MAEKLTLSRAPGTARRSGKLAELRARGLEHEGFREGYEARGALIRLGEMLRGVRETAGLTQEALAAKIGMTQPTISRLESGFGPRGPEVDTVMRYVHGCNGQLVVGVKPAAAVEPLELALEEDEHSVAHKVAAFETVM